jgi:hypothetical protein
VKIANYTLQHVLKRVDSLEIKIPNIFIQLTAQFTNVEEEHVIGCISHSWQEGIIAYVYGFHSSNIKVLK